MSQQISESELVLMKIIWKNGGAALYSVIMEELEKDKNRMEEQHRTHSAFPSGRKKVLESQKNRQEE